MSLGLKFITNLFGGKEKPFVSSADFTRSFDSLIEVEAMPTMLKEGRPFVRLDST